MRPINKEILPDNIKNLYYKKDTGQNDNDKVQTALIDTIGNFCSICELPLTYDNYIYNKTKANIGLLAGWNDWENLLLTCESCKAFRIRGGANINAYAWPDHDNTFDLSGKGLFNYILRDVIVRGEGVRESSIKLVVVEPNSSMDTSGKAKATINLFQLNSPNYSSGTLDLKDCTLDTLPDRRIFERTKIWMIAEEMVKQYEEVKVMESQSSIPFNTFYKGLTIMARNYGFWSIWMSVFWQKYKDRNLLDRLFLTTNKLNYITIYGHQGIADLKIGTGRQSKRNKPTYLLFAGTAVDRIKFTPSA